MRNGCPRVPKRTRGPFSIPAGLRVKRGFSLVRQKKFDFRVCNGVVRYDAVALTKLGQRRLQEFSSRRKVVKQVIRLNTCSEIRRNGQNGLCFVSANPDHAPLRRVARPAPYLQFAHGRKTRKRLPAKPKRFDPFQILERLDLLVA